MDDNRARFAEDLSMLSRAFPKLVELHLILGTRTNTGPVSPDTNSEQIEAILLQPPLEQRIRMGYQLRDFIVAAPSCLFLEFLTFTATSKEREDNPALKTMTRNIWDIQIWCPFTAYGGPTEKVNISHGLSDDLI